MIEDPDIEDLRRTIDEIDHELLRLLARRIEVVLWVGDRKRAKGFTVYDPIREERLLERLAGDAEAPLDGPTVRRVFQAIIAESRRIEKEHIGETD